MASERNVEPLEDRLQFFFRIKQAEADDVVQQYDLAPCSTQVWQKL